MRTDIKPGDLVMVVKPTTCCGNPKRLGQTFIVPSLGLRSAYCPYCRHISVNMNSVDSPDGACLLVERLRKIAPPPTGDSLPTRAELEQSA